MLTLNLLPPSEKEALAQERIFRWVFFYGGAVVLFLLLFFLFLIPVEIFIGARLKSANEDLVSFQASFQGQNLLTQEKAAIALNQELDQISARQKSRRYYSRALANLAKIAPPGARLESIDINDKNEVILNGWAANRDSVLTFQDALAKSGLADNLQSPISNLVKQTDITFIFKFSLTPSALLK